VILDAERRSPQTEEELEEILSRPTEAVVETLSRLKGDFLLLGVSGKIGPSLARMVRRGLDASGSNARVYGVARFRSPDLEARLRADGIETVRADLTDRDAVRRLPAAENAVFMAGYKFGAAANPEHTWATNVLVPAGVAEAFRGQRMLVFSTGCVYPVVPVSSSGSREEDPLEPMGEYANSCVGRERVFGWYARQMGYDLAVVRLNYAVDLRYGVLVDIARKVRNRQPIDVTMGFANVIWQRDANAIFIRALAEASSPPFVVNVTGPEAFSVRDVARRFGQAFGVEPVFTGLEEDTALLSDVSKANRVFGEPPVKVDTLVTWVAEWMKRGGPTLDKPTHYEVRNGRY
jgi:nucleoside-diphosphate-sugar epimerase